MSGARSLLWLAVALLIMAWGLGLPNIVPPDEGRPEWEIRAQGARWIGDRVDPFAYAGGGLARPVDGAAVVELAGTRGTIRSTFVLSDPLSLRFTEGGEPRRTWEFVSTLEGSEALWVDAVIHGSTGRGDRRLPPTAARFAGWSRFDVLADGKILHSGVKGFWSVADALRRSDGSIGQRGLVFSPLLRDQSGFSDPSRLECTILLYQDEQAEGVLAHFVFSEVVVTRSPYERDGE